MSRNESQEELFRKIAREELDKSIETVQLSLIKDNFLTREEFALHMDRMDKRFEQMLQQSNDRFFEMQEQMNRQFTEMDKRFNAMQEQMDKRFNAMQEQMDRRFDEMDKRFKAMQEQMDERFNAMQEQMDERFKAMQEQMDKRFNAMQEQMDERFKAMQEQMDKRFALVDKRFDGIDRRLDEIELFHGDLFEGFSYTLFTKILKSQGINTMPSRRGHFIDDDMMVHPDSTDVEVDLFSVKIPLIGEVTRKVGALEKVEVFVRKIKFLEQRYKQEFRKMLITLSIAPSIENEVIGMCKRHGIELVVSDLS